MWEIDDLSFSPEQFSGRARLFPLPNLVLFPNVMQPLHIFEPRYVAMVENCLADDRLIASCLLREGWEDAYEARPPVFTTACLGKIASFARQADGTFNILLLGLRRIRLLNELPPTRSFREADVKLLEDIYPPSGDGSLTSTQQQLLSAFQRLLPELPIESEPLEDLLCNQMPLGMLTDIVAYTLDLELKDKQELLSQCRVAERAQSLMRHLKRMSLAGPGLQERAIKYPPHFSAN